MFNYEKNQKQNQGGIVKKRKPIKVVYNVKPDPVNKITEYTYTGDGLKKVKETNFTNNKKTNQEGA